MAEHVSHTSILTLFEYARKHNVELSISYNRYMGYRIIMEDLETNDIRRRCDHYFADSEYSCLGADEVLHILDYMLHVLRNVKE